MWRINNKPLYDWKSLKIALLLEMSESIRTVHELQILLRRNFDGTE